ncbi:unnamed protein product [Candidula unifasciata]|uniref:Uncharacterized protein n=1 Tax=Candidula unifasciata TaxID=100452 RepID=A0A8S3YWJ0_9EUPU|nr:unnamed protein product [Candidula unifasciata]
MIPNWKLLKLFLALCFSGYLFVTLNRIFSSFTHVSVLTDIANGIIGSGAVHASLHYGNPISRQNSTHECTFPDIDPFDPAVMAVTTYFPPIYITEGTIKINHSKTFLFGDQSNRFKECRYISVAKKPGSDFETVVLYNSSSFNDSMTLRDSDNDIVVECSGSNKSVFSRSYFSLIRVKKDLEIKLGINFKRHIAKYSPKETFNILMIGIDGHSKQNLQRHMPKTRNYLLNVLDAVELHKYNRIGDNTFPNLVPILTGKTELELTRRYRSSRDFFDNMNDEFVWSEFSRAGYRTGLYFDSDHLTAFHFMKKGWDKPPVDYYYRATLIERARDPLMTHKERSCVGDIPELSYSFDFWKQMSSTFQNEKTQPYFGFGFCVQLTHDEPNHASEGDGLYLRFFEQLNEMNVFNNTIVIFFSDHGERLGRVRRTYNGMIEANMPHVFLVFPPWFHRKYPNVMEVLKINQDRLTTNKDLHATLLDVLNFQGKSGIGDVKEKGISLFNEIPGERSCEDAEISAGFCVCNRLTKGNVSFIVTISLATAVQSALWGSVIRYRHKCQKLTVKSVDNIMEIQLDSQKLQERDEQSLYQITVTTTPGNAVYEARLSLDRSTKVVNVVGNIIRLNLYRGQDSCMDDPKLKPFCYCGKQ